MTRFSSPWSQALAAACGILIGLWCVADAMAAGYWQYEATQFSPSEADLQTQGKTPGRTDEKHVSGGFQAKFSGQGTIDLFFKNDDVDRHVYVSRLTFTYGAAAPMDVLVPGDDIQINAAISFKSNFPGAQGTGAVAVDNGDYAVSVSVTDGQSSGTGTIRVPGGGPGATLRYIASAHISAYGGFSETMTNLYSWVEGEPPADSPGDEAEPAAHGAGSFDGAWATSEGDMSLVQSGSSVTGTYSVDNGRITGEVAGGRLAGYWAEDSSGARCATEKLGSYYWGRIEWTLSSDGTAFAGAWSYCDDPVSSAWTGKR